MVGDEFPARAPTRPIWLVTLADLALLLLGFLVMVQASQLDHRTLAGALRAQFGADEDAPLAVAAQAIAFDTGSAIPRDTAGLTGWARESLRDPRVSLTVAGATDGSPRDVDATTGSAALLAADRARGVAALLAGVVPADRLTITTTRARRRAALVTQAFTGDHRD